MRVENRTNHLNYLTNNAVQSDNSNDSFAKMLEKSSNLYLKGDSNPTLSLFNPIKNNEDTINETQEDAIDKEKIDELKKQLEALKRENRRRKIPEETSIKERIRQNFEITQLSMQIDLLQGKAFGKYSIDENGFMGEDFNIAAGLPLDYKIVYKDLGEFYYDKTSHWDSYYKEIDMAKTVKNAFAFFQDFVGDLSQSNAMLSPDKVRALPHRHIYTWDSSAENRNLIMQLNLQESRKLMESWDKIGKTGVSVPFSIHNSLIDIDKILQERQDPRFYIEERYFEGDKISMSGLLIMSLFGDEIVGERSEFFYETEKYEKILDAQMQKTKEFPNTYVINYDIDQRFWDLLNGKISVESHLQKLIDLGYTHNGTINWSEDKDKFSNDLSAFLKVFQEILDSHSLNAQKLQELNKGGFYQNTQIKQDSKDSKPYEAKTKQEKMQTFLNNLLKVG
ncbi:MAG: hypothetical protein K2I71_01820 [Helicobacter sp.]|nr:hypothetical protein [Helicobacter sp.]